MRVRKPSQLAAAAAVPGDAKSHPRPRAKASLSHIRHFVDLDCLEGRTLRRIVDRLNNGVAA